MKRYPHLSRFLNKAQFGSMYDRFKYEEGRIKVLEPLFSAIRRLIMVAAMVYLYYYPTFQIMVVVYSYVATIIFNGIVEPFIVPKDYIME